MIPRVWSPARLRPLLGLLPIALLVALASPPEGMAQGQMPAEVVQARIEVGEFHLRSGRWREAAEVFAPLAQLENAPVAVFRGLGEAYHNLGRRADAIRALETAQQRGGDVRARLLLVELLGDQREGWPRAIELLQQHVEERPDAIDEQRRLGDLLVYEGRIAEAVPVLETVVASRPDDAASLLLLARTLAWTSNFERATTYFERGVAAGGAIEPDDHKLLGQAYEAASAPADAHRAYRAYLRSRPNDTTALSGLARTALALGRADEARDAVERLRDAAGRDPELELAVARLDVSLGRYDRAIPVLTRELERSATPKFALEVADALVAAGRIDAAIDVLDRFPDTSPSGVAARLRILASAPERREEARGLAAEAMQASPDEPTARIARDLALEATDAESSLELLDLVARRFPRDRAVQTKRANVLLARGQKQGAEAVLRQLQATAPRDASVLARLVATQVENRNFADARRTLAGAGDLVARDARLLSLRAGLKFRDGQLDAARADYDAALKLAPQLREARVGRAEVAFAQGDLDDALRRIEAAPRLPAASVASLRQRIEFGRQVEQFRALPNAALARELEPHLRAELERSPERGDYRLLLAQILEASGRSREALAQYGLLQRVAQPNREAFLAPVRIHLALGEQDEADRAFALFQQHYPGEEDVAQGRLLAGQGDQRKRAGDFVGALEAFRSALTLAPRSAEIWRGIAGVHFASGQLDDAVAAFESALEIDPQDPEARRGRREALLALAGRAVAAEDRGAADTALRRALGAAEGDAAALQRLADLALAAGHWDVAVAAAERLPDAESSRAFRERLAFEREFAERASDLTSLPPSALLALARRGLAQQPNRSDLLLLEAQALERLGQADAALTGFRAAAERGAASPDAWAGQVRVLTALGRTAEAARALDAARARDPEAAREAEVVLRLAEAEDAKRRGHLDAALGAVRRALVLAPDNADAHLSLAGVYAEAKQHGDAIAAYRSVLARRPGDAVALRGLAGAQFASGAFAAAEASYEEILQRDPANAEARRARVELWIVEAGRLLAAEKTEAAEAALDRALAVEPNHRDALTMKLRLVGGRQDWAQSRRLVAAVGDPSLRRDLESWLEVEEGMARWRADASAVPAPTMLRLVERGLRTDPNRSDLRLARAQLLEASGQHDRALAAYREVGAEASAEALTGQVRMLTALNRFGEAERLLDRYATRPEAGNRERAQIHRARASAMRELGRNEAAFAAARDALALAPGDADTLALLGWIYLDAQQPRDAAASFAGTLARRPQDRAALEGLASAYEAAGDWEAAERAYLSLASLPDGTYPPEARARIAKRRALARVAALRAEKRLAEAAEELERLRQSSPRDPEVWASLSEVRGEIGQASLALTYAEQGLQLAPSEERLHLARIRALGTLGRHAEADAAVQAARGHVAPGALAQATADVARARQRAEREHWLREGRLDLAYLSLAEEFQIAPNDPDILRAIGFLFLQTEQYAEARPFFERAALLQPQDADAQLGLAYALRGAGDSGAAAARMESVMRSRPSADTALALAEMYHEQGRNRDAAKMLEQARRLGGEPRRVLPPLRVGQARALAPELRAERSSVLPPLMLPEGALRAVPDRAPVPRDDTPDQRPWWRDGRVGAAGESAALAFADTGSVNDAAPPHAAAFAGPALPALRRHAGGAPAARSDDPDAPDGASPEPAMLAQALPSFDQVMQDVGGGARRVPPPDPVFVEPTHGGADGAIRDEHIGGGGERWPAPAERVPARYGVEDYFPAATQRAEPVLPEPRVQDRPVYVPPSAPLPYDLAPEVVRGAQFVPALPPAYRQGLYLERDPAGAGLPIRESVQAPAPLSPQGRARLTALERKLQREQAMKLSAGFRYDFFNSVSDVNADEFAVWRFPLFLEVPALINSRLRVTAEPTVVDNGLVTDAGVAGEVALLGMRLGTDRAQASVGVGVTPAGFIEDVDLTGFGRLTLQLSPRVSLTPLYERKPVIESLLSYRGNEREGIFFGKVMQDRFGAAIGLRTPQEITGVIEAAYSRLRGVRVERNERIDAFFSIGRDFPLEGDFVVRPGAQAFFMHYDKDLSEAYPLGLDPEDFPVTEFPPGGGYFSPDSFIEAALRLDLLGPLMPDLLPGSRFRVGGRVGGQWVSGLETPRFASSEGSRATFGGDAGVDMPLGEFVVFSAGAGFVVAKPYDRVYFEMALLFPL